MLKHNLNMQTQTLPNGTEVYFLLQHVSEREFCMSFDTRMDIAKCNGKRCTVNCFACGEAGVRDMEYYDVTFEDGTVLHAVSGFHLEEA